ncbi:DUF2637 domain-containing protein [Spongiactinospora rosea]|uniref:DUF2637 domain-containing protein n=1 Tax=Spongiactinospora rosea TaxID=2248750 RepID=UPI0013142AE1|nr:DUF2637 domain-containing protein [Spongiactinospora rosea]
MRRIQFTTIAGIAILAGIAAAVSFRHMHELCLRHGEDHLTAVLIPLAVDGTIVVASMSILLENRYGSRGGALAWTLLTVGSLASLGANIAVAEPSLMGRISAAWLSAALIGSPAKARYQGQGSTAAQEGSSADVLRSGRPATALTIRHDANHCPVPSPPMMLLPEHHAFVACPACWR